MKQFQIGFLSIFFFLPQCITFARYDSPGLPTKSPSGPKKVMLLSITQFQNMSGERKQARESDQKKALDLFVRALTVHPHIDSVITDPNQKYDVKLDIHLESEVIPASALGAVFRIISFLTVTALPFQVEQNTRITYEFTNPQKRGIFRTERTMKSSTWVGLLTIPLMPFYSSGKVAEKSILKLSHSSLNEAIAQEAF